LEILHRAAPCRNVPVTFTLDVMKSASRARSEVSTVIGFFVAPLVAAIGVSFGGALRDGATQFSLAEVLVWTLILYFYALVASVVLGLPAYLILRRIRAIRWWSTALAGFVIGSVVISLVDPRRAGVFAAEPSLGFLWSTVGALSSFTFWVIWRRGHPGGAHDA
jgi:hypothetical protein